MKFLGKALWAALRALHRPTINVCFVCLKDTDEHIGSAGDYGLCARCRKPIASHNGFEVREPQP